MNGRRSPLLPRSSAPLPLILPGIILLAFALRMFNVGNLLMWGDEGFSVFSSSRDLLTITLDTTTIDPHPPLYYFSLHFYFQIFGRTELAIRFFSVFFGTATIAIVWLLGKQMFGARAGVLATFIAAISPFAVHYSQEIRMYALAMFLVALGLYFFVRVYTQCVITSQAKQHLHRTQAQVSPNNVEITSAKNRPRNDTRNWLGYTAAMLLALFTLYHTALIFLAIGLVLLTQFKTCRAFVVRWFAISFGIVAAFLPWLAFRYVSAFTGIKDVAGETQPLDLVTYTARSIAAISVGTTIPLSIAFQLAGMFVLLIVIALVIAIGARAGKFYDALLVLLTTIPILAYYPLYLMLPLYRGRLFALACIPFVLLIARSATILVRRARLMAIPIIVFIVGVSAYSINNYYFHYNRYSPVVEDYIPLIRTLERRAQPGDVVLIHAYWHQGYFLSHYTGAPLEYLALDSQRDLEQAASQPRNVWAIVQALPRHGAEDWLAQNAFSFGEEKYGQMRLLSYRAGTPARGASFTEPISFDNGMQLLGYHVNDTPIESGRGIFTLQLDWQAAQKIAADYWVSVRLNDPRGEIVWAQADAEPSNGTQPTSTWQPGQSVRDHRAVSIPAGTPPGDYQIQVVVYDAATNHAANIVAPENRRGQAISLGNVSIRRNEAPIALIVPNPFAARWNEILLAGFATLPDEIGAGDTLPLTLYWHAQQKPAQDYRAWIRVVDAAGVERSSITHRPANDIFPTRAWNAGETWLDKILLTLPADTAPGEAKILVGLIDEQGNAVAPSVELARVKINAREHRFDLPTPAFNTQATFGGKIKLLGYDFAKPLALTLYWQATDSVRERYKVFVHVLDKSGNIVAQRDAEPQSGAAPTTSWLPGEVITDRHQVNLPKELAGEYWLVIGLYQTATGKRLIVDGTTSTKLGLVKISVAP